MLEFMTVLNAVLMVACWKFELQNGILTLGMSAIIFALLEIIRLLKQKENMK